MIGIGECLSQETLTAIACSKLADGELRRCEDHLENCAACCEKLEVVSADAGTWDSAGLFLPDDDQDVERFTCDDDAGNRSSGDTDDLLRVLTATDDPHMLGRLGAYEVSGIVGVGGMGVVLKALDPALSRFVALKVLAPRFWEDAQARERFAREARAAASIVHDNVIEVYGVAEVNGIPFFTMPYLRADSLQKRIDRQGWLQLEEILRIAMQVAAGLSAAHAQGLVHRDVKPANILLNDGADRVCITDFGIAQLGTDPRITQTGLIAGTPQYMSPEQIRGEAIDGRSDLFSLGSVMYAMCTGQPPFRSDSSYQLLNQVVAACPPPIEDLNAATPSWVAAIVSKLHAPSPADRYQSAAELAEELEQCLASVQQPETVSQPQTVARLDARYRRRYPSGRRKLFLGGLLMFGTVIAAIALLVNSPSTAPVTVSAESISVRGQLVDAEGNPIAKTTILAVQKTWPKGRYRQQMLEAKTDRNGNFVFEDFAEQGNQYASNLTVISDRFLMVSEYRVVKAGTQQEVNLVQTKKALPITFRFNGPDERPLSNVKVLPTRRTLKDETEYSSYGFHHVRKSGWPTNTAGEVRFASWLPGEKAQLVYLVNDQVTEFDFTVPADRTVDITVQPVATKAAAIHVEGQVVDSQGQPVAKVDVLAIQKTWPNNRFRQNSLSTTTDANGKFHFAKFASAGTRYAYLLTVVADGFAMTSEYQFVKDGAQQTPMTLTLEKAAPVTLVLHDEGGRPLPGVDISPGSRQINESTSHLNYASHMENSSRKSDAAGHVAFSCWKPGESGSVYFAHGQEKGELKS